MTEIPDEFSLPQEAFDRQRAFVSARVGSPGRPNPIRRRRVLVPALAVVVLAIAGAATAGGVRFWNGPSTPGAIDTKEATSLVQYTLTSDVAMWKKGDTIALWRMPQADRSVCFFDALASSKPTAPGTRGPNPAGGGSCSLLGPRFTPGKPINVSLEGSRQPNGSYTWLIDGHVNPASGITRLEIRTATGSRPLAYDNNAFLGELSASKSPSELSGGGPYLVVGYDSHGTVAGEFDLLERFKGLGSQ
jgi:hypothetical protein